MAKSVTYNKRENEKKQARRAEKQKKERRQKIAWQSK